MGILLNAPLHEVLMTIKNTLYLPMRRPWPLPLFHTGHRDKFCEFHQDFGHNTESYKELWDFIEDLIGRGYMKQFVAREERAHLEPMGDRGKRARSLG